MAGTSDPARRSPKRLRKFVRRREGASRWSFELDRTALKDAATIIVPMLIVIGAAFWITSRFIRPAPPDSFVMSTGAPGGAYHLFAQRYQTILARDRVSIELKPSAGSLENLKRLMDATAGVDAALVQGGVAAGENVGGLVSLGSVYYEPLWVFYRAKDPLTLLNQLIGKRIAVGPDGSGTRALALRLLDAVGATASNSTFEPMGTNAAADALVAGKIDVSFMVGSPDAPAVQRLIRAEGVRVMSIANAEAYTRRFPFLTTVMLPRGVVDLARQLPADDITLLATTATLVVREDFHPALAFLLLHAATEVHAASGLLQKHREFPAARESDFPLAEEAQRYHKAGPPFLHRHLPFWLANLIERIVVLLVPIFAVLVPAFKILPGLFEWRVKRRIFRWYGEIKFLEDELLRAPDAAAVPDMLEQLDEIEHGIDKTPVPVGYADYAYNLRAHVDVVRNRILRLTHSGRSADGDTRAAQAEPPPADRP